MELVEPGNRYTDDDGRVATVESVTKVEDIGLVVRAEVTGGRDRGDGVWEGRLHKFIRAWVST